MCELQTWSYISAISNKAFSCIISQFHISVPQTLAHTLARWWARGSGRAAVVARWLYIIWAYKVVMGCYEGVMGCHKNVMVCYEGVRRRSHTFYPGMVRYGPKAHTLPR